MAGTTTFQPSQGTDYLERNCVVGEPRRLCIYDRVKGKILKTVDSVYQAIDSREDCEDLCNTAPFRYIFRNFFKWFFKLTYFPLDVIPMITTTLEISFAV